MTIEQRNYYDMYLAVDKFYTDNQAELDLILARKNAFLKVQTNNPLIGDALGKQSLPGTGITLDKQVLRDQVDQHTYINTSIVASYARSVENNTLYAQMNYPLSTIAAINDESIADWAEERKDIVSGIVAALVDYGITAVSQTAWQSAIDAYRPAIASTRDFEVDRSGHTLNLDLLILQTRDHLTNVLDKLMSVYRFSNPVLYARYKTARSIVDLGHGHASPGIPGTPTAPRSTVMGKVSNAMTLMPVIGASVKVVAPLGDILTVTTDALGNYVIEFNTPAVAIEANLVVEAPFYYPSTTPFTITTDEGGTFPINVELNPQPPMP